MANKTYDRMKEKETEESAKWFLDRLDYASVQGILTWKQNDLILPHLRGKHAGSLCVYLKCYLWRKITRTFNGKVQAHGYHRVAWLVHYGTWPEGHLDHIDGDSGGNNRITNLRVATYSENSRNKKVYKSNKSGVTGVLWQKRISKWTAQIKNNGRQIHLGCFTEINDAVSARKSAEKKYGYHENHGRPR